MKPQLLEYYRFYRYLQCIISDVSHCLYFRLEINPEVNQVLTFYSCFLNLRLTLSSEFKHTFLMQIETLTQD